MIPPAEKQQKSASQKNTNGGRTCIKACESLDYFGKNKNIRFGPWIRWGLPVFCCDPCGRVAVDDDGIELTSGEAVRRLTVEVSAKLFDSASGRDDGC